MGAFEGTVLAALTERERAALGSCVVRLCYADAATIIFRGEVLNALYLLESGRALARYRRRREVAPLPLNPGDFFGESALVEDATSDACVRAQGPASVLTVPAAVLRLLLAENRTFAGNFLERLELRQASLWSTPPVLARGPFTRLSMN